MDKVSRKIIKINQTIIERPSEGKSVYDFFINNGARLILIIELKHGANVNLNVHLSSENASAFIVGLIEGRNDDEIILQTMQLHEAPHTLSNLLIKTVLYDKSNCKYYGGIRVEKSAQKTDAYQRNENLLMSSQTKAQSEPALEILANDVRCTHGATVSMLDPEQIWYLNSRGLSKEIAQNLLIDGFLNSAINIVPESEQLKLRQLLFTGV